MFLAITIVDPHPITSRAALLHVLGEGPGIGAELNERIRGRTGGKLSYSEGAIYTQLRLMEEAGLIRGEDVARAGRDARCYTLTTAGEALRRSQLVTVVDLFTSG